MRIRAFEFPALVLTAALGAAALGGAVVLSGGASAEEHTPGGISIAGSWSFELPPVAPNGAAYFRIENRGPASDRLVSAHSPIAASAEIHAHEMDGGMMTMCQVHSVEVPAQGEVAFEPGGLHVMLLGLKKPLVAGERYPLVLEFEKAGTIEVAVEITSSGSTRNGATRGRTTSR